MSKYIKRDDAIRNISNSYVDFCMDKKLNQHEIEMIVDLTAYLLRGIHDLPAIDLDEDDRK